ncbi:MAG: gliding motility lipoprotein GldJ [Bacteroidia bacterium]|nr:MAG: gliding motility lipoprotein GldJ [Bacteroidia bacterium]
MRLKVLIQLTAVLSAATILSSCGGGSATGGRGLSGRSESTGWLYNDEENGGFEVSSYNEQETGPGLVFVEGGAFQMGRVEQDVVYAWNNMPRRVTVSSFYIDETEVKNVDYLEYLFWLRRVFVDMPQVYQEALPDTLCWRRPLAYNEPYVEYYFRSPNYYTYPVVGVTWIQASNFCDWRTDRVNEQRLVDKGILRFAPEDQSGANNFNTEAYMAGQYDTGVERGLPSMSGEGERTVRMEDGILLPRYQLPTEAEWEYAALALKGNSEDSPERIWTHRLYPWNGHYLRKDTKRNLGKFMANFKRGRGDMMGLAGALNDRGSLTVPVDSYWPNDFGLYCMAGNVNEWVRDVYRSSSSEDVEDFNPFRGNIFKVMEKDEDGNFVEKDSLGRMKYREMTDEENAHRHNYRRSYNINYKDGDVQSSVVDDWMAEDTPGSSRMYKQGDENGVGMRSLVTDRARVYKGGGWRDKAYWLVPGNRRFLDEGESRDDLGFRCSMVRLGSPDGYR